MHMWVTSPTSRLDISRNQPSNWVTTYVMKYCMNYWNFSRVIHRWWLVDHHSTCWVSILASSFSRLQSNNSVRLRLGVSHFMRGPSISINSINVTANKTYYFNRLNNERGEPTKLLSISPIMQLSKWLGTMNTSIRSQVWASTKDSDCVKFSKLFI